jgi:hypothetical protein
MLILVTGIKAIAYSFLEVNVFILLELITCIQTRVQTSYVLELDETLVISQVKPLSFFEKPLAHLFKSLFFLLVFIIVFFFSDQFHFKILNLNLVIKL